MGLRAAAKDLLAELIGKPEELAALRDALQALPAAPPPGRPEMAADERRAIGADFEARYTAFNAAGPRIKAAVVDAQRRRRVIDEELARLAGQESDRVSTWVGWRDVAMARLWRERPALVDELIALCEREAVQVATSVSKYDLPSAWEGRVRSSNRGEIVTAAGSLADMARTVTNAASCAVRRKALVDLAESLRDATAKGAYSTLAELQAFFDEGYKALPPIEHLRDVLRKDVRGYQFVQGSRSLPKSAA